MMTRDQLRGLHRAGVEIGGHTITHPILTSISDEDARREISAGKAELEAIIGAPVKLFAFPNGKPNVDYARRHVEMVREAGFDAAFSTVWGAAYHGCDPFQLPRIAPWRQTPLRYGLQVAASFRQRSFQQA
jgi:peptidoglycan/xylan/chitin deacetylase (PgdA/CDA1 family)